jgi:DNA repair protein RecO
MALIKTEAVVLKTINYRDRSKIVTLYTQSHGKIKAVAKGVRDVKTRWGGVLQPMAYINAHIYYKENRGLQLISGAEYLTVFHDIYDNTDKMNIGFRLIELLDKTTAENHEIDGLFELLTSTLNYLNDATKNFVNLLFNFEFRLAKLLGFGINLDILNSRNRQNSGSYGEVTMYEKDIEFLKNITGDSKADITEHILTRSSVAAIDSFFDSHYKAHFDNLNFSNTKKVIFSKEIRL